MKKFLLSCMAVLTLSVAGWAIADESSYPKPDNVVADTLDLTEKLANPNFNDGPNGWTVNTGKIEVKAASTGNPVVTAYGYQMNISQKVSGLEPGKYLVKVQACSRYKDGKAGIEDYEARKAAGQDIPNEAYLYANGEQVKVVNIWDETSTYDFAKESGQPAENLTMSNGEQIPYNSTNFANAFRAGMYENELTCTVGADGELTLGLKNVLPLDGNNVYVGYDNFRLYKINEVEEYTSQLANPNFNDGTNGWTVNAGKIEVKAASTGNPVVTAYGYQVNISQKVTGLKPGKYLVKVQACSRYKDGKAGIEDYEARQAAGQDIPNEAYLYANGQQQKLVNIWDETSTYDFAKESGQAAENLTMSNGEQIPYNSTNFANAFGKLDMYWNELTCTVGKDGELTVGLKNELPTDGYNVYVGYDNFRLYRVGELDEEDEPGDEPADEIVDCTNKIVNPGFTDNSSTAQSGWTLVTGTEKGKWSAGTANRAFSCNNIKCELTQVVEGLEPGKYKLYYQAFGRMKANEDSWASYLAGEDLGSTNVYMVANATKKEVMNVVYGATPTKGAGDWTTVQAADGSELYLLNNSGAVADAFAQGYYQDSLETVVGKDGKLTITFQKESVQDSGSDYSKYAGCDNFRLYHIGDAEEEPVIDPADNRDRIAIPAGSPNGSELNVEVLEKDEAGNILSAKYTVTNGTWGNNASHLSFFKFAPLSAATIAGYEKIVVEFAETVPTSTGDATYGFIPVGLVSPVNWTSMNGRDKWEYTFTEDDKAKGIEDFSLFFNASGSLKDIEVTITGMYLVKPETDEPGDEPGDEPAEDELDMSKLTDMTALLANPNFDGGSSAPGWTVNTGKIEVKAASTGNPVITAYDYQVDICQTVTGLEPGKYVVMVQACSRHMMGQAGINDYESKKAKGQEIQNEAYLYANGEQKKVKNIYDEGADYDFAGESGQKVEDLRLSNGKQIPYNSTNFANAFGKFGMYQNYVICTVGQNGVLTLGIKNELQKSGDIIPYLAYDNFRLYKMDETEDFTNMLANPNFNDGTNGWTVNEGKIEVKAASTGNPVVTAYNYQVDICQTVEGLKPGRYILKVQACSRYMDKKAGIDDYEARKADGRDIPNEAYIYANGKEKKIVNIYDETNPFDFAGESGQAASDLTMSNGEQIPYNSNNFARAFGEFGMYENELECVVGQNGILTLGIKNMLKGGDGIVPYVGYDNFRLFRVGDAEEDGPAFDLYDLKANAGDYVAVCMPYAVKTEYFGQVYKIAQIQDGQAVLVATDAVATGVPCVIKASGENNVKEGDVTLSYATPKATVSMWDNTMMQGDLNKLTWTATAVDGSEIDMATLTYTEVDLANMEFTATIENNAAARFWAQNPDYMAETPTAICKYLNLPAYNRTDQPNPVLIPVVANQAEQTLSYCLSEDMMTAETVTIPAGKSVVEMYNLLPGLTYYYKTSDGQSAGKFTVGGKLRMMMIGDNVVNMRDLGGKKTVDGRYVKYGKIFRNAEFKGNTFNINETELQKLLDLNIGAELDLRNEDGNKPWLPNAVRGENFYWAQGKNYIANGPGKMYDDVAIPHLKGEFELIVNNLRKGVAVDFHCRIGADRTGFLAFLLEGLLGVSETDILLDYETTSFSEAGLRTKADGDGDAAASSYEKVIPAQFRSKIPEGGTLRDVFEAYFINTLGVDKALIDEFRDIMLADSPVPSADELELDKLMASLQQSVASAGMYVFGDDLGQYTATDQAVVDDFMAAADAAAKFLESDSQKGEDAKALVKTLAAAQEAMAPTVTLNMPKEGDMFYLQSKSYGNYVRRSGKNWAMSASKNTTYGIFTFDGEYIMQGTNTFASDAKTGLATGVAATGVAPAVFVPSATTVGCYNLQIGDAALLTTGTTDKLTVSKNPNTDADLVIVKLTAEEVAIQGIEAEGESVETYNLNGQKVNAAYKGVVIRGGKKVMVK